jgi:hypothetical protein
VAYLAQCPTTTLASDESSLIHFRVPEGERSRPFVCPLSTILPPNKSFRGLSPKKDSTKLLPLDNIAMTPEQIPQPPSHFRKWIIMPGTSQVQGIAVRDTNKTFASRKVILSPQKHYRSTCIHTYMAHHRYKGLE